MEEAAMPGDRKVGNTESNNNTLYNKLMPGSAIYRVAIAYKPARLLSISGPITFTVLLPRFNTSSQHACPLYAQACTPPTDGK